MKRVSRTISAIGAKALVVTSTNPKRSAGAHDLRRSFASRWTKMAKPMVLQKMMRHAKLETTMKYYAELDVDHTSAEIWAHFWAQSPC